MGFQQSLDVEPMAWSFMFLKGYPGMSFDGTDGLSFAFSHTGLQLVSFLSHVFSLCYFMKERKAPTFFHLGETVKLSLDYEGVATLYLDNYVQSNLFNTHL